MIEKVQPFHLHAQCHDKYFLKLLNLSHTMRQSASLSLFPGRRRLPFTHITSTLFLSMDLFALPLHECFHRHNLSRRRSAPNKLER
jgi:hypothetical protein